MNKPVAVVDSTTPKKANLNSIGDEEAPSVASSKKGMKWDDELKLRFLLLWIDSAEEPFYVTLHNNQPNKKKARETIEYLIRYKLYSTL